MRVAREVMLCMALSVGPCVTGLSSSSLGVGVAAPMNPGTTYTVANALDNFTARSYRGEYFELLSDVQNTQYSEVRWQPLTQSLPEEIVSRFDGKVMVITGLEADIVRGDSLDNLTSVPCFEQYNHHWSAFMSGKAARLSDVVDAVSGGGGGVSGGHGEPLPTWDLKHRAVVNGVEIPSVQAFSEGNGNEHRGSWHGYPAGYGQLIYSPTTWQTSPMIINTNKRLTDDKSPGPINHDLVPRTVLSPPDSAYSGILECPCTTRTVKILDAYSLHRSGSPPTGSSAILTAAECASAAAVAGIGQAKGQVSLITDVSRPPGCFGEAEVTASKVETASASVSWNVVFNNVTATSSSASCGTAVAFQQPRADALAAGSWDGSTSGVSTQLILNSTTATITLSSVDDGSWFGVAFNASSMADTPYAIIVDGSGDVSEYRVGDHAAGSVLSPSIRVLSSSVEGGIRTVSMSRALSGATASHFSFDPASPQIPILSAHGTTAAYSYHGPKREGGSLIMGAPGAALCISRNASTNAGTIAGHKFNADVCAPFPTGELVSTHNPICNISEYNGGLLCCAGGTFLLDADQVVPEATDAWRMRYRFYFEDYAGDAASTHHRPHTDGRGHAPNRESSTATTAATTSTAQSNLFRVWWSTEATNNEYDVPKSPWDCQDPATPVENCTHTLVSRFTGLDMLTSQCMVGGAAAGAACGNATRIEQEDNSTYNLIYAAAHCHTPACQSLELWNDDTGELLCRNAPVYGSGGTNPQNESAYVVAIPPCVWGSAAEGLRPPPVIHLKSNLSCVKRANATYGHWGTMALWQMRGAYINHEHR